jgi:L,D-transpeptidase catalytic domain
MLKFLLILLLTNQSVSASDPNFEMRISWITTLKEYLSELEKNGNLVGENDLFMRFKLMEEAWADSRYNCFYGGWPSVKKGQFCQRPSGTNSKSCQKNSILCQPLLFGKGKCVRADTQAERNKTFSNCEKIADKNFNFLQKLTRKETEDLRELSLLAYDVCEKEKSKICEKIKNKLRDGLKSIDHAFTEAISLEKSLKKKPILSPSPSPSVPQKSHSSHCQDPLHEHEKLARSIQNISTKSVDALYDKIKSEFQSSPLCDPLKVVSDPSERPSGFLMAIVDRELKEIDYLGNTIGPKDNFVEKLSKRWRLSSTTREDVLPLLNQLKPLSIPTEDERRNLVSRAKGLILQDILQNYQPDEEMIQEIRENLASQNIFSQNEEGVVECPFVSKDAFTKALGGREEVLKKFGSQLTKRGQITIVDYSRPSNERRLFVIDLDSGMVLHNTWVAHGAGGSSDTSGEDSIEGSPDFSNMPGSMKSSDGFILALRADQGLKYGPNVILSGIDENNSNLERRSVVMHGWGAPMDSFTLGVRDYNLNTGKYDPPYDVLEKLKGTDFKNSPTRDMEKALWGIRMATAMSPSLAMTEGCLGVTEMNVKHLDRKGRNNSQLHLLREDLPGSLIFSYSGPQMKSKFF